jgi:hypothetical protein
MKEQLIQLLKRPPRAEAVATMQAAQEFKKFYAAATKKLAKSMTETEVASLYQQTLRWY